MRKYTELEQKLIDKEQSKLKKFKISYYYIEMGMEGVPDIYPEKIIEAPTKELATYIYHLMFTAATSLKDIERTKRYKYVDFSLRDFETFLKWNDESKYWGISIEELT